MATSENAGHEEEIASRISDNEMFDAMIARSREQIRSKRGFTPEEQEQVNERQKQEAMQEFLEFNGMEDSYFEVSLQNLEPTNFVEEYNTLQRRLNLNNKLRQLLQVTQVDYKKDGVLYDMARQFCEYYITDYAEEVLGLSKVLDQKKYNDVLNRENGPYSAFNAAVSVPVVEENPYQKYGPYHTLKTLCEQDPFSLINVDQKVFVEKVSDTEENQPEFLGGYSQNYNYNKDYLIYRVNNRFESLAQNRNANGSVSMAVGGSTPVIWGFRANANGGTSYNWNMSTNTGEMHERGKRASVGYHLGQYLIVQQAKFNIPLDAFKMCVIVQPKTKNLIKAMFNIASDEAYAQLFENLKAKVQNDSERNKRWNRFFNRFGLGQDPQNVDWDVSEINFYDQPVDYIRALPHYYPLRRLITSGATNEDLIKFLNSGFTLCSDTQTQEVYQDGSEWKYRQKVLQENYYYIYQHFFTESPFVFDKSLKTRPWLGMIRGDRDYFMFRQWLEENGSPSSCSVDRNYDIYDSLYKSMQRSMNTNGTLANNANKEPMVEEVYNGVYDRLLNHARFHTVLPTRVDEYVSNSAWGRARSLLKLDWMSWGKNLNDMQVNRDCEPQQ
ncbi:MAG: hypothetical protein R2827_02815 [Bdellovibrionales bacterium]